MNRKFLSKFAYLSATILCGVVISIGCSSGLKMPKLPGVLSGGGLSGGGAYDDASAWEEHTLGMPFVFGYDAGMAEAREQNRPAMIFMTTTWCHWCKKLSEACFQDAEIRSQLEQNFVLVLVDGDTEPAAKRKLENKGYPHIIFLSPEEEVLANQNGYAEPAEFKKMIAKALAPK